MVKSGYGNYVTVTDKPVFIAEDLREAADWIIQDQK